MPNTDAWATPDRPTELGELIVLKSTSITIVRDGSPLAAQTVRLETLASQRMVQTAGGVTHQIDGYLLGYLNHPTVADTDIESGDRFRAAGRDYEVIEVLPAHVDCVQAYLKVRS